MMIAKNDDLASSASHQCADRSLAAVAVELGIGVKLRRPCRRLSRDAHHDAKPHKRPLDARLAPAVRVSLREQLFDYIIIIIINNIFS